MPPAPVERCQADARGLRASRRRWSGLLGARDDSRGDRARGDQLRALALQELPPRTDTPSRPGDRFPDPAPGTRREARVSKTKTSPRPALVRRLAHYLRPYRLAFA